MFVTGVDSTSLFLVAIGCATRSGQRSSTGFTGAQYRDRMPTPTLAEQSGIGRQLVQNTGKLQSKIKYLHKLGELLRLIHIRTIC